jgi:hypothetical protein
MRGKNEAGHLRLRGRMNVGGTYAEIQRMYTSAVSQDSTLFDNTLFLYLFI